jgi:O-antigen ligase
MIKARPVFGFGPGNYGLTYEDYHKRCRTSRMSTLHAHNEYLEMTAEYGLVGAALVLCVVIGIAIAAVRLILSPAPAHHALPVCAFLGALAGTAVHGFFDFELRVFPNAMTLALLAGCAVAPLLQQRITAKKKKQWMAESRQGAAAEKNPGTDGPSFL